MGDAGYALVPIIIGRHRGRPSIKILVPNACLPWRVALGNGNARRPPNSPATTARIRARHFGLSRGNEKDTLQRMLPRLKTLFHNPVVIDEKMFAFKDELSSNSR
jgi:hypothetical protein